MEGTGPLIEGIDKLFSSCMNFYSNVDSINISCIYIYSFNLMQIYMGFNLFLIYLSFRTSLLHNSEIKLLL